jgi:hypothetical protein
MWLFDFVVFYGLLYLVSKGIVATTAQSFILYAVAYSQMACLNAVVGHELIHRRNAFHKVIGTLAYAKMLYAHYFI